MVRAVDRFTRGAPTTDRVISVLLAFGGLALFSRALGNGFISLDDPTYIVANPFVQDGLSSRGIVWAFTTTFEGNWDPITWRSHMLDVETFGSAPAGHHLTSVLLHVANGLILFHALRRMTGETLRSGFVAALLAVLTALALRLARRASFVAMGWLWFLGTLVPVIGIVQFGGHARADRFTYIPLVGLFVALAWGLPELLRKWAPDRWLLPTLAGVTLAVLAPSRGFNWGTGRTT